MSDELVQMLREWHEDDEDLSLMRDAADEIERQAREIERLRECLRYEQHRFATQGTHSDGCYAAGPMHYECALMEIERLRAEVAEYRGLAAATYQAAGAHDWPVVWLEALSNAASGRAFSAKELLPMETPDHLARAEKAESALAALHMQYDSLKGVMHDEIAANLAFREAGGALPEEDMPTFCARLVSERAELRKIVEVVDEAPIAHADTFADGEVRVVCILPQGFAGKRVALVVLGEG